MTAVRRAWRVLSANGHVTHWWPPLSSRGNAVYTRAHIRARADNCTHHMHVYRRFLRKPTDESAYGNRPARIVVH